ncbi:MAG TPA: DUF3857 domain-containing protein [Chitinophagaceae bacterium]|nr:DUF3857 domain-containing protein [Chitinophagaceae bacterium]
MRYLFFATLLLTASVALSQSVPAIKFGKITEADFKNKVYAIDTGANAVVLADIGSTQVKGSKNGWFSLEYKYLMRIHILKNSGYDKATVEIPIYREGELEEELSDLKASTYNLENGKVVETKLNTKTSLFKEKINKNKVIQKFTLPNVKEGSIIEYEYRLTSDFLFNIQSWTFQGDIPSLWSQYTVSIPQFLHYTLIPQGNLSYYLNDRKDKDGSYMVVNKREVGYETKEERIQISCGISDFRWAMKDIPAFKEEPFTSSPGNYVAKLEFQLAGYLAPLTEEKILTTWPDMTKRLLKQEDFGIQLENAADWLPVMMKPLVQGATQTEIAKRIYNYVRDNFTCTDYSQLWIEESLKKTAETKKGGVAEINLLLTAMLRYARIAADPVILSTRDHGFVYERYPVVRRFNYVICQAKVDGKEMLLDASRPRIGFGRLHYNCYNGQARVVNEDATILNLKPDQLTENRQTSIFIYNEPNGKWTGHVSKLYGYYASDKIRQKISADGNAGLIKELNTEYGSELKIDSLRVDSLLNTDQPVTVYYAIKQENEQEGDILYVNPVLGEHFTQNPFKSADRQYPVEMPYKLNELYSLSMEIPEGYMVDELPKPVTVKMNTDDDAVFQYKISKTEKNVYLNYKLEINQPFFYPAEYNSLREFFNNVVAKLDEQVVFKRKPK